MSTPDSRWIVVDRWDEFQHPDALRTGTIPWLKTFTRLLSDSNYLNLNAGERAVLHGVWLEYARARGQLTVDTASLTRRLSLRVTMQQLEALNHAGFIHFSASKPASNGASTSASTDKTRRERSSRTRATPQSKPVEHDPDGHKAANPFVCPIVHCGGVRTSSQLRLIEHIYTAHNLMGPELVAVLDELDIPVDLIPEGIPGGPAYAAANARWNAELGIDT